MGALSRGSSEGDPMLTAFLPGWKACTGRDAGPPQWQGGRSHLAHHAVRLLPTGPAYSVIIATAATPAAAEPQRKTSLAVRTRVESVVSGAISS